MRVVFYSLLIGFLGSVFCGCQQPLYRQTQVLMDTFVEVVSPDERAPAIAFTEIKRIEGLLSKYQPNSEVWQLNRDGQVKASRELMFILLKSKFFYEVSEGAFDITVAPLVDIWGFTDKKFRVPSDEEIHRALESVGTNKILFNTQDNVIQFTVSGMKIDLGAIAKGYAVDCAAIKLKEAGITSCLINAGGQVYCLGKKSGKPWKVAMWDPRSKKILETMNLSDRAVATSGDYEQFFIQDGKRFSHIMDPRTGRPEDSGVISATVVADDGLTADALATAIVVLGKDKSRPMLERFPGAKTMIIDR